ncbi:hypothetical protein WS61_12660 [Burkholderia sp. ABCPW 11]|nr:hypothetical protein WS61_12660 [Burkholderia sp. ABCPW 11]
MEILLLERVVGILRFFRLGQVKQRPVQGRVISVNSDHSVHEAFDQTLRRRVTIPSTLQHDQYVIKMPTSDCVDQG